MVKMGKDELFSEKKEVNGLFRRVKFLVASSTHNARPAYVLYKGVTESAREKKIQIVGTNSYLGATK